MSDAAMAGTASTGRVRDRLLRACAAVHWRNLPFVIVACIGAVIMLMPLLWSFGASFRPAGEAYRLPPSLFPDDWNPSAYVEALQSGVPFLRMYWNSFLVAAATTAGVLITCAMAAFAFARLRFRGRDALFALMLIGLMIPPSLALIPTYLGFAVLRLTDSLWALILPGLASSFGVYMLRQFMLGQPKELEEAAFVDGAGHGTIFWRISLPQLLPAMSALGIITFTASWNNFLTPFVMIKSWEKMTLPVGVLALQTAMGAASLSVVMAATVMAIFPLFIVFLVAQRFIIEGMTSAGIRG